MPSRKQPNDKVSLEMADHSEPPESNVSAATMRTVVPQTESKPNTQMVQSKERYLRRIEDMKAGLSERHDESASPPRTNSDDLIAAAFDDVQSLPSYPVRPEPAAPGAYCDIPGRELVRADALEYSVLQTVQTPPFENSTEEETIPQDNDTITTDHPLEREAEAHFVPPDLRHHPDEDANDGEPSRLTRALVVEDVCNAAELYDVEAAQQKREQKAKRERCTILAVIVILLVAVITLVPVLILVPNRGSSDKGNSTVLPSDTPSASPESRILSLLPQHTLAALEEGDQNSPQARAYEWTRADPSLMTYSDERILQRFALGTLFYATKGEDWRNNASWMSYEVHECNWHHQDVVQLTQDIYKASTEPIPDAIVNVTVIPFINASAPCEEPVVEQKYSHLWLPSNNLRGHLPPELYLLTSLKSLVLGTQNRLKGLSSEIGKLSSLETLQLVHVGLGGQLPTQLGLLTRLHSVFLRDNKMSATIPTELGLISDNLQVLDLAENELIGTIPESLGSLTEIQFLDMQRNELSGTIPTELGNLRESKHLFVDRNKLEGAIASELGLLENMVYFGLSFNSLTQAIPSELGMLMSMERLFLMENSLTGSIPTELGRLQNVERLGLYVNQLSGVIPTELGLLRKVQQLGVGSNELTGSIPSELGILQHIHHLYLDTNSLLGSVPLEIANLVTNGFLKMFHIYSNALTGTLPSVLCSIETASDFNSDLTGCTCNCSFTFYYPGVKICSPLPDRCA